MSSCPKDSCKTAPIPKECVQYCLHRMLRQATVEECQLILGLDAQLAETVYSIISTNVINRFEDFESHLVKAQIDILIEKFESLNQYQLNYFNTNKSTRQKINAAIQELSLDNPKLYFKQLLAEQFSGATISFAPIHPDVQAKSELHSLEEFKLEFDSLFQRHFERVRLKQNKPNRNINFNESEGEI